MKGHDYDVAHSTSPLLWRGRERPYAPFFTSALLMCMVLFIIYPHYQYYVDPDGVAYLTISKRYAAGDIQRAINGYWSPWACWLTAGLIKVGFGAIPAGTIINTLAAIGFLCISQSFFLKFNITRQLQWLLNITLALFLCYAVFWQSFDDLWECFFLLCTLRLILGDEFKSKPLLWVACGLLGTLAYFAKAYSFPFFILNTICCVYFISKDDKARWIKISLTAVGSMILSSLPWIWALHNKYGLWTTSTAGTLNMSWYLVGHPHWKPGISVLIPPPYPDSPYYWEDPWYANGDTPHFWDSWHLFGLQVLRVGLNIWKFLLSNLQLSIFFPVIFIIAKLSLFHRKVKPLFTGPIRIVVLSFLLFPLGYLLINFESRYLWYMLPLGMVIGALFIQKYLTPGSSIFRKVIYLFTISFLIYPLWQMGHIYNAGKMEYNWAAELKKRNIKGSFTSMCCPGVATRSTATFAYFSGCTFFAIPNNEVSNQSFISEMRRYNIKYYIACDYYSWNYGFLSPMTDENGIPFPMILSPEHENAGVLLINP